MPRCRSIQTPGTRERERQGRPMTVTNIEKMATGIALDAAARVKSGARKLSATLRAQGRAGAQWLRTKVENLYETKCFRVLSERIFRRWRGNRERFLASEAQRGIHYYKYPVRCGPVTKTFRFKYVKINDSWRAYILGHTYYFGRNASAHATHRIYDNGYYICWDRPVAYLDDMVSISEKWAEETLRYIRTGKGFG